MGGRSMAKQTQFRKKVHIERIVWVCVQYRFHSFKPIRLIVNGMEAHGKLQRNVRVSNERTNKKRI